MKVHHSHIEIESSDYKTDEQRKELFKEVRDEIKNMQNRYSWPLPSTDEEIASALCRGFNAKSDCFFIMALPLGTSIPVK